MVRQKYFILACVIICVLFVVFLGGKRIDKEERLSGSLILASPVDSVGFKRALPPAEIKFPDDFGPHPEFQTEWWYYTGNLATNEGRRFGYQLTIFRRALLPIEEYPQRSSAFGTTQVYMGHFALTDIQSGVHLGTERFARGALEIAGAQASPYSVWLEDWSIREVSPSTYRLNARQTNMSIDLTLIDRKGPVLHGVNGYSQKGPDPGNSSNYYSQTRLATSGRIILDDKSYTVSGFSWKDHEYSTSALSENQVGWDWFAIQLEDDTELKVFNLRREDGTADPYGSGSFIDENAEVVPLTFEDFSIVPTGTWKSSHSGAEYPSGWKISVPRLGLTLNVHPLVKDQELNLSYSYWEGAVEVKGEINGQRVSGYGYVELTGYAGSMAGEF